MSLMDEIGAERQRRSQELAHQLAAARQARLCQHQGFIAQAQQDQMTRARQAQELAQEIRQFQQQRQSYQNQLTQERLAQQQVRAQVRRQVAAEFSAGMQQFLQDTQALRLMQTEELRRGLSGFAQSLSQETQRFLQSTAEQRQAAAERQRQDLSAFLSALSGSVDVFLKTAQQERGKMAATQAQELSNFCISLQYEVDQLRQSAQRELQERAHQRQIEAQALRQSLSEARQDLQDHVWGSGTMGVRSVATAARPAPQPPAFPSISSPAAAPRPTPAPVAASVPAPTPVADPPQIQEVTPQSDGERQILDYVNSYVSTLKQTHPDLTLLQVIGNRDMVRELLAQGAGDLEVDPSEILGVLRRMVSSSSVAI